MFWFLFTLGTIRLKRAAGAAGTLHWSGCGSVAVPALSSPGLSAGQSWMPRPGHTSPGPALPSLAAATAHGHAGIPFPDCRQLHFPLCHSQKQWGFKYQQWQRQFLGLSVFWYQFEAIFEAEAVSVWQPPLMSLSCKGSPSDCCSHLPALMGTPRPGMESTKELLFEMQT